MPSTSHLGQLIRQLKADFTYLSLAGPTNIPLLSGMKLTPAKYITIGLALIALLCSGATTLSAQLTELTDPAEDSLPAVEYEGIPPVNLNTRSVNLQQSLYPDYYQTHSALRDLRWVERNDSALADFWRESGPFVLYTLAELSGLQWLESEIDLYLVRYYHKEGNGDPAIIPVGGVRKGALTESMPTDIRMQLNVIYQMAHRMLAQAERYDEGYQHPIARHPLMQPGVHRRDNLAMLLALVTCERLRGLDSTFAAYQSAFWQQRHPGREVFEKHLLTNWILSADQPLTRWVLDEPRNSQLVALTRPPRTVRTQDSNKSLEYIEDLPLKGSFGFSLKIDETNKRVIHKIDPDRIAFACGLREGDVIRSVDGQRIRNQRDMVEKVLATYRSGGSTLQIVRDSKSMAILLQPLDLGYDDIGFDLWNETDSLYTPIDQEPIDSLDDQ